jgi:tRNA threonylcarbamoyladenosine biosynthesis protein TsaB
MPKILSLDSSTEACSCALSIDGTIIESFEIIPRGHTRHILSMIQSLMQQQGLGYGDLDALALGAGPGSFTGLRIATGVAQGIAFGADLPLVPVSTLASMAWQKRHDFPVIMACLDARINELYWAVYQSGADSLTLQGKEKLTRPEQVLSNNDRRLYAVGNGMAFLDKMPKQTQNLIDACETEIYPRAAAIAELAAIYLREGRTLDPADFSPIYLRNQVTHN